jgi:hypothetical protein
MVLHFLRITAITGLILLAIFLPYMRGNYDGFAVTLSSMSQVLAVSSLLLVPLGMSWLIYEIRHLRVKDFKYVRITDRFSTAALIVSIIAAIVTSLGATMTNSLSFAVLASVVGVYILLNVFRAFKKRNQTSQHRFNVAPLYLILIPLFLVFVRFTFIVPATGFSREVAISQSSALIRDIEAYEQKNGHYPSSLLSLWEDYKPSVIGIERYHYEPNGAAYNVYFEQFSYQLGVREIVMYNKLDQHEMTSHNYDLLHLTPEALNYQRGYFRVYDLPIAHWKYFWFD